MLAFPHAPLMFEDHANGPTVVEFSVVVNEQELFSFQNSSRVAIA
jgi:hypothetical protein